MEEYIERYHIPSDNDGEFLLKGKDFSLIKNMGFDAISLWDFRRDKKNAKNKSSSERK
ncbi:MAG: hypothetical protein GF329_14005, partial [Candidatus Lokiarchaeota archaeon]|nr:hypothetical protein [Candidatus Lokiarchaeota archaeon]